MYPNCLQATLASELLQPLLQIFPQASLIQISTFPSSGVLPSTSLMSPVVQLERLPL